MTIAKASYTKNYVLAFSEDPKGSLRVQVRDRKTNTVIFMDLEFRAVPEMRVLFVVGGSLPSVGSADE